MRATLIDGEGTSGKERIRQSVEIYTNFSYPTSPQKTGVLSKYVEVPGVPGGFPGV